VTAAEQAPPRGGERVVVDVLDAPDPDQPCAESTGDIVDQATGLPRLLSRKCNTCIYRPGNLMHLQPGRRDQMEATALARDSWIVCHSTLPAAGQPEAGICRGFYDIARTESLGFALARFFGDRMGVRWPEAVLMEPPTPTYQQDTETT
jgi:hypothetical protein